MSAAVSSPSMIPPRLGAVLTARRALGSTRTSDHVGPPIVGNGFVERFAEDLAALSEVGVRAVRLSFDWARLQPVPGRLDDDWREWYGSVLMAARASGVEVWATLHEDSVPGWFDDEGSFGDERASGRAWPRWVEVVAEEFGDRVDGWFPIVDPFAVADRWSADSVRHERALLSVATAWRDAWRILRGGPPVASALGLRIVAPIDRTVPAATAARLEDHLRWRLWMLALRDGVVRFPDGREVAVGDLGGSLDLLGAGIELDVPEGVVTDDGLRRWHERFVTMLHRLAEEGPQRPITLSSVGVRWRHEDERRLFVETTTDAVRSASTDGIHVGTIFIDPAIGSTRRDRASMLDRDRATTSDTEAWQGVLRGWDRPDPPRTH